MKIIWSLKSIPEFKGLSYRQKETEWKRITNEIKASGKRLFPFRFHPFGSLIYMGISIILILTLIDYLYRPNRFPDHTKTLIASVVRIFTFSCHIISVYSIIYGKHQDAFTTLALQQASSSQETAGG